ncbi:MAG: MFS transporter [Nitriliruptorales bacterium]|nr:MFS transporter [Nitriliruptorales bacterium]
MTCGSRALGPAQVALVTGGTGAIGWRTVEGPDAVMMGERTHRLPLQGCCWRRRAPSGARGKGQGTLLEGGIAEPPVDNRAWRVGFGTTLALAMGMGPSALYALNVLSPLVVTELGLSRAAFGSLASLSFAVAVPCSMVGGRVVDRMGGRRLLVVLFASAAVAVLLLALAGSYLWLLAAAAVAGFSQSTSNPVTNQLVSAHLPAGRQGLVMGVKQSGVQMTQFAVGMLLPPLAVLVGWRASAAVLLVPAVAALALTARYVPGRLATAGRSPAGTVGGGSAAFVWWLCGYLFLVGVAVQAANAYLPLYAFEVVGLPAAVAGSVAGLVGAVGIAGRIGLGRLAERTGDPGRLLVGLALAAVLAFATLAWAGSAGSLLLIGAAAYGATAATAVVVVMISVVRSLPPQTVGRATGLMSLGLYAGFASGPVAFGALVDATGSYRLGWTAAAALCAAGAGAAAGWRRSMRSRGRQS